MCVRLCVQQQKLATSAVICTVLAFVYSSASSNFIERDCGVIRIQLSKFDNGTLGLIVWGCRAQRARRFEVEGSFPSTGVPGHSCIQGNELANELTKAGLSASLLGPEPFYGIHYIHIHCPIPGESMGWSKSTGMWQPKQLRNSLKQFALQERSSYSCYASIFGYS